MSRIAIVDGVRTPFCKMGTEFNSLSAQELGRIACRELIERTGIDVQAIDEVIIGNVGQPADAANIARVIALLSGVPETTPAYTVHRNCASGIEAAVQASMKIKTGEGECYLVGGAESMSHITVFLKKPLQDQLMGLAKAKTISARLSGMRKFYPQYLNFQKNLHHGLQLGLTDPVCGLNMGQTAEVLAKEFGISRWDQDEFALVSHQSAVAAREILKEEIVPVIPAPEYKDVVESDNGPREHQTMEALAKLKPFFDRRSGTITAGNSSQVTDGAAALLIMTEKKAKKFGLEPLGFMSAYAFAGVEPHRMGIGPAHAIPKVLQKARLRLKDIQAVEINEAFAAQVLACLKALASPVFAKKFGYEGYTGEINPAILNVNGGAVALGHPVGSTGARLILTMLKHMQRNNLNRGLVSLCVGGGQGAAVILER
jgi:acetyl-CoA acetyltransferase family protein